MSDITIGISDTYEIIVTWTSETEEEIGATLSFMRAVANSRLNAGQIKFKKENSTTYTLVFEFSLRERWRADSNAALALINRYAAECLLPKQTFEFRTDPDKPNNQE